MNLIDAIKSGRPIRRNVARHVGSSGNGWLANEWVVSELLDSKSLREHRQFFTREDLLADDWEIQEPTVTITRSQFWEAWAQVSKAEGYMAPYTWEVGFPMLIAKKLGLEG